MASDLEKVVRDMLDSLDRSNADGVVAHGAEDMQGIDEISRGWMRGLDAVGDYIRGLVAQAEDIRSEMKDVHEVVWGDAGFLTFWLEQDYTLDGTRHHISAPTSVALRREGGHWKVVLFHSVPLPE